MDDMMKKPLFVLSTILISLCYCYFISSRIPKGFPRLISLLPILYHFTFLPLYLSPAVFPVLETAYIAWPCSSRLAFFAVGKGPLSSTQASQSLYNFIIYAALPIRKNPTSKLPGNNQPSRKKLPLLLLALVYVFLVQKVERYYIFVSATYFISLWIYTEFIRSSFNVVLQTLLGLELEKAINEPYETTSLQDFWGKRWNLTVTDLLREGIYDPYKSASAVFIGNELARAIATLAAFTTSGLLHELLVHCFTLTKPSWETTAFFVLQGFCVVLEVRLKRRFRGRLDLPWFISMPLTLGFVFLTSAWLFLHPLVRNGVDVMAVEEICSLIDLFKSIL